MSQSEIPEGWEEVDLSKLKYEKGKSSPKYKQGNHVYLSPEYLRNGINPMMIDEFPKCVFTNGEETILLWDGSNAGEIFKSKKGILASTMVKFVVKDSFDSEYFFYSLKFHEEQIKAETRGSGIPHVDKSTLGKLKYTRPKSLAEQQKIAHILLTIDNTIDKTKELIEKNKKIKQGLMQTLLNKMESGWEKQKISDMIIFLSRGRSPKYAEFSEYAVINQACIHWDEFKIENLKKVTSKHWSSLASKYKTKQGDVFLNSTGTGTIGRVQYQESSVEYTWDSHVTVIRTNSKVNSKFLYYTLQTPEVQNLIDIHCITGSTNQIELSREKLKELQLPIPTDKGIQDRVCEILTSVDKKIKSEQSYLSKLLKIKAGLMQDLLTGKVGVAA
jgi:type I restriction enzyme S subunit